MTPKPDTPQWKHDDDGDVFLGRWLRHDLYFRRTRDGQRELILVRCGNERGLYISADCKAEVSSPFIVSIAVGIDRARTLGLMEEKRDHETPRT